MSTLPAGDSWLYYPPELGLELERFRAAWGLSAMSTPELERFRAFRLELELRFGCLVRRTP